MKIKGIAIVLLLLLTIWEAGAQQLTFQGKITYERKENMHKLMDEESDNWFVEMKKRIPKYRTDLFQLSFNKQRSAYKLYQEEENQAAANSFWRVAWNNNVLMDLQGGKLVTEKSVYDKNYHIVDSLPVYTWKLSGEYREIAGYTCRKATTIIMDSLFVIAFYTDEIPVSSGPESINGLPGMILGAVIPKLAFTIFATKVEQVAVPENELVTVPLKKAKTVDRSAMLKEIDDALKDWGRWGQKIYWRVVL